MIASEHLNNDTVENTDRRHIGDQRKSYISLMIA